MPRFYKASETVIAEQWGALGDLPGVVQQYQRNDVANAATCVKCGRAVAKHGWIAAPLVPMDAVTAALPVDLMSGQPISVLPQALPASGPEDRTRVPSVRFDPVSGQPITVPTSAPGNYPLGTDPRDYPSGEPIGTNPGNYPAGYQTGRSVKDAAGNYTDASGNYPAGYPAGRLAGHSTRDAAGNYTGDETGGFQAGTSLHPAVNPSTDPITGQPAVFPGVTPQSPAGAYPTVPGTVSGTPLDPNPPVLPLVDRVPSVAGEPLVSPDPLTVRDRASLAAGTVQNRVTGKPLSVRESLDTQAPVTGQGISTGTTFARIDPVTGARVSPNVRSTSIPTPAGLDPARGDLNGIVVCPGDWVITYRDGEREAMSANTFKHLWVKADPFAHQVA